MLTHSDHTIFTLVIYVGFRYIFKQMDIIDGASMINHTPTRDTLTECECKRFAILTEVNVHEVC